jgi:hypothetical protein
MKTAGEKSFRRSRLEVVLMKKSSMITMYSTNMVTTTIRTIKRKSIET